MEFAVQDKMTALAITDHGNLFGALDFYTEAKEYGLKPIIGCELYIAPCDRTQKGTTGSGDDDLAPYSSMRSGLHHIVLLVQNMEGYLNLSRLVSTGFLDGFYYKPRVDRTALKQYSKGLISLSSCLKGEVTHAALMGDMDRARDMAKWYQECFENRFYLEMQYTGLPQNMIVNQRFQELSKDLNIPLVASADAHYLQRSDAFSQEVLMSISAGRTI